MQLVDLSHPIEAGMVTYKGLPAPVMCDFLSREASRAFYTCGHEFQIGRIDMVGNTGTYLDSPFHRFADGKDLSELPLASLTHLPGIVVRQPWSSGLAVDAGRFSGLDLKGKAVLIHTGWDAFWRTDRYFENHPFLTEAAALHLADAGARLVGIDSHNIDDTRTRSRPVHTALLGREIPICEHLCDLGNLPDQGFEFFAVPPRIKAFGTFPVRAYARIGTALVL
jgi:arylformamidase